MEKTKIPDSVLSPVLAEGLRKLTAEGKIVWQKQTETVFHCKVDNLDISLDTDVTGGSAITTRLDIHHFDRCNGVTAYFHGEEITKFGIELVSMLREKEKIYADSSSENTLERDPWVDE